MSLEALLSRLRGTARSGSGWKARCPAHSDERASLSVAASADGTILLKCHAGCSTTAIVDALGMKLVDLFPSRSRANSTPKQNGSSTNDRHAFATAREAVAALERQHGKRSHMWTYHDVQGQPVGVVLRWDSSRGKTIRPVSRHPDGWHIGAMPEPRPLYRLPELAAADRVVVCEGEKTADAARSLGFVATTSPGGAMAAGKTDWSPLAGKEVWILPDNDKAGRQYAETVADILTRLTPAAIVRVVELPDLPDGGDLVDWITAQNDQVPFDELRPKIEELAQTIEPRQPEDTTDLSFHPFPVDALPEPVQTFVRASSQAIGCDASFIALPLLAAIAAAIGNTRRLALKRSWLVPPILWTVIVGESGTCKTPAFRLALRSIRKRQHTALDRYAEQMSVYETSLVRWESEMATWKRSRHGAGDPPEKPDEPHCARFIVSDITVEALAPILLANPRGLLLARDELAGWIGSFDRYASGNKAGTDLPSWLSMFNAESMIVDRKSAIPRTIHIPQAFVCIAGGIQPAILRRVLRQEHRESGLVARLLMAWPPRQSKRWSDADIDLGIEAKLDQLFDRLYQLQLDVGSNGIQPALVHLSADAKAVWEAYFNAHAAEHVELMGDLAATWSKLEEYAARLALIIHIIRWAVGDADETLDAASMNAGIALTAWFKHEARRVHAMLNESDAERDLRRLIEWIERKGGTATPREIQRGCRWLKEPGAAEAALDALIKAGYGAWQNVPVSVKSGRLTRAFVLSTCRHVDTSTRRHVDESVNSVSDVLSTCRHVDKPEETCEWTA